MQIIFKQAFGKKLDCSLIDEQGFGRYENPISKHWGTMESFWVFFFPLSQALWQERSLKYEKEEVLTNFPYFLSFQRSMGRMDWVFPPLVFFLLSPD